MLISGYLDMYRAHNTLETMVLYAGSHAEPIVRDVL